MSVVRAFGQRFLRFLQSSSRPGKVGLTAWVLGGLVACTTPPNLESPIPADSKIPAVSHPKSLWQAARFEDLPGWSDDSLHEAWSAWMLSCQKPHADWVSLCPSIRQLSIADDLAKRQWMQTYLQPYRVTALDGNPKGLLTSYYEPELVASRQPNANSNVPLYRVPSGLQSKSPWYSRREIDTLPDARAQLRGRELVYLSSPIDALILHIQGSGKARIQEPDGRQRWVRLAFAGTNEHPYKSVARWLVDQGQITDTSWAGIREWAQRNPGRVQDMLWSNPRYVFFKEEPLNELDASVGPKGAQGVPLTAGRSIAVDPGAMPYGTPVWLSSASPSLSVQRLVIAQDTGSAITGAVRADYYAGSGATAGDLAGKVKQGLDAWVLWPR